MPLCLLNVHSVLMCLHLLLKLLFLSIPLMPGKISSLPVHLCWKKRAIGVCCILQTLDRIRLINNYYNFEFGFWFLFSLF